MLYYKYNTHEIQEKCHLKIMFSFLLALVSEKRQRAHVSFQKYLKPQNVLFQTAEADLCNNNLFYFDFDKHKKKLF